MAIKRFGEQPEPEQKPHVPSKSMFTPFQEQEDHRRAALGDKVYTQGQNTEQALEEAQEEFKAAVGDIERAMPVVQELLQLYQRMAMAPSATTYRAFTTKVQEATANDSDHRGVLAMSLSIIANLLSKMTP